MWASAFPGIRIALTSFSPSELAFLRFAIASAALAAFWTITRPPLPRGREWLRIGFAGGLGISAYNLALNEGEMLINAGTASFLMSLSPMFSVLLGVLLHGERLTRWGIACVALSFIGVELLAVFGHDGLVFNHGAALVLLAAICQAMQFVIQKPLLERYSALAVTTCVIWAGTLFLLPFASTSLTALGNVTPSAAIALLFLALGPAAAAYMTWSYALSHYPVSRAVGFLYLIPPISILVSFVTLDERPTAMTLLGGLLALLGVIGMNTIGKQR
jgi:drug/metabolite transporter (DMT)-like permease